MADAAAIVPAVDVQTPGNEAADADTETARVETGRADVERFEQIDVADGLVGRQRPGCLGGVRDHHRLGDERLLIRPGLVERALDRLLAERDPCQRFDLVGAGELLVRFVVPSTVVLLRPLRVEEVGMDGPDIEHSHRGRRTGHEYHAIVADGFEGRLIRELLPELDELVLGVSEAPGRGDLVGGDEIRAEDRTG
ncbi:MAG: hypothetical protein RLZZ230_6 [Candidatus Parcubacteria bacterium]